ncbi:MAG: dipeptidase [Planctomycetes bacterium]|nr:dipeptidase [Planctomycetota bacterium]
MRIDRLAAWAPLGFLLAACGAPRPSAEQLERARALTQRAIVVDGHIDVPYRLQEKWEDVGIRTEGGDFDYPRAKEGGLDAPFMSIYTPAELEEKGESYALANKLIDDVERIAREHPSKFELARTAADVRRIAGTGKIAFLLGMENGSPVQGELTNVDHFFRRGIRYITLCHGKDNHLCDSSYDQRHTHGGLSGFGKQVVERMNRLGILVDVSHLNDDSIRDVLAVSKAPVFASHSSCRKFTPEWERNVTDDQIRAIAAKGGIVMINFGSAFIREDVRKRSEVAYAHLEQWQKEKGLRGDEPQAREYARRYLASHSPGFADVRDVADHVEHVIALAGVEAVGFGSDFDGVGDSLPVRLKDVSQYPELVAELLRRGHSEADLEKIVGGNALRVLEAVERRAAELQAARN